SIGRNTEPLVGILYADPLFFDVCGPTSSRIQQPDAWTNKLLKVFVTRNDDDVHRCLTALRRERTDDVIGFVSLERQDWNLERIKNLADAFHSPIEVRLKFLGQLLAGGFVRWVCLMAKRQPGVVYPADILGAMV